MEKININDIRNYLSGLPVEKAWIFGSYARGEESEGSDVDILISFKPGSKIGLFKYVQIAHDMETIIKKRVDLVEEKGLYPSVKTEIEKERILIYER